MANRQLTTSLIAKAAVKILDNELVMARQVYRGYEDDYDKRVSGYTPGDTIQIRRPTDFTVRDGRTASIQDVNEGKTTIVINKQKGVDFAFTSTELTLNIDELADRVIKPAMVQLANQVDRDLMALYADVWNWVGTPGQTVDAFADFAKAPERLDNGAVPSDQRYGVLSTHEPCCRACLPQGKHRRHRWRGHVHEPERPDVHHGHSRQHHAGHQRRFPGD